LIVRESDTGGGKRPGEAHSQRLAALARANQVRSERAELKARVRAGEVGLVGLIAEPPKCLGSASVAEVLLTVPGVGKVRLRRVLDAARLSPAKALGTLTERQRTELIRALGPWR
jgi:hypothetical protein